MKKKSLSKSAFFNTRGLIGLAFCSIGLFLALVGFAVSPGGYALAQENDSSSRGTIKPNFSFLERTPIEVPPTSPNASIAVAEDPVEIDLAALLLMCTDAELQRIRRSNIQRLTEGYKPQLRHCP